MGQLWLWWLGVYGTRVGQTSKGGKECKRHKNWQRRTQRKTCEVTIDPHFLILDGSFSHASSPRKPGSGTVRLGGKASRCCLISRSPTWGPEPQTQIHLHGKLSSSPYKNQTPRTSQASSKSFEDLMKGILRTFPFGVGSDSHDTRCYQDAITSSPQENRQWANKCQQSIGS